MLKNKVSYKCDYLKSVCVYSPNKFFERNSILSFFEQKGFNFFKYLAPFYFQIIVSDGVH